MALLHYLWSRVASANATADANINFAEGQAPSSVNDSARALMASAAGFRDDISGAIVTGGTSTAYTVSSYQVFDTLAHMNGMMLAFTPHATNGTTVTLNVDGLGAKPLRTAPAVELMAGTLVQGTPYVATYNNSDGAWYLQSFFGNNPYNIPLAGGLDYWGGTAPNSSFVFPIGQAISRTTYATLFAIIGSTFGAGDGSTTFNLPDKRGRVSAANDSGSGRLSGGSLAATLGTETHTLALAQIPTGITSAQNSGFNVSVTSNTSAIQVTASNSAVASGGAATCPNSNASAVVSNGTVPAGSVTTTSNNTSGGAHPNVQPTIVCNYIIRII